MGVIAFVRQTPSGAILVAQLVGILAYPFMEQTTVGRAAFAILGITVLSLAVLVVRITPFLSWLSVLIAAPAMVLLAIQVFTASEELFAWSSAFEAVLYFYAAFSMTAYMLADTTVGRDELFAIGTVFTFFAWAFAYVFVVINAVDPSAFTAPTGEDVHSWMDMLFLSFTTLTGTGMTEMLPISSQAKSVIMIEQVVGLFYVAMVVTRLIGLQAARKRV